MNEVVMISYLLTLKPKNMHTIFICKQLLPNSMLLFYTSLLKLHKMSNMQIPNLSINTVLIFHNFSLKVCLCFSLFFEKLIVKNKKLKCCSKKYYNMNEVVIFVCEQL